MNARLDDYTFELLTATVAATVFVHIGHLPLWLWLPVAVMLPLRAWTRRRGAATVGAWIRLPLTALLLALVISWFGTVFGREPGSVLGCGLLALKLLETEHDRDARVALGFAAFVLMSALLFTQSLAFTALICCVLLLLVATLVALQPAPLEHRHRLRAQFGIAARLLAAGLPLAAAAFVLVPRLGSPLWGSPGNDALGRTGLGERMAPGELTELLVDDTPAFRVSFDGSVPPPQQRYFRTLVLWDFDGAAWTRGRVPSAAQVPSLRAASAPLDYTITLEPTDRRWLPALDLPLAAPDSARLSDDRVIVADRIVSQARRYGLRSVTDYVLDPALDSADRDRALALPDGFDPKARALALGWRAEGRNDDAVIRSALDLFHASFTYTLRPPLLGRDSIDDFLFSTRQGFCEHYSSSFVFLMRAAGIPARVVTGYQGGWWNESSGYLLLRQSDAHAWAEVWLPGRGWRRVDPTAAVSPERIQLGAAAANGAEGWAQSEWLRGLRNRLDIVNRLWSEGIVRFDALRQRSLLTPFGIHRAEPGDLLLVLSCLLGVALLLVTLWAMRNPPARRGDSLDRAWLRLQRRLTRAGLEARDSEGPLDWLRRVRSTAPALAERLAPLVGEYVELRYGTGVPPRPRLDAFANAVRNFRMPRLVRNRKAVPEDATARR